MKPWLHLARISNLPTVWTNVTAAWILSGGGLLDARLAWLIFAGSLLYIGGMILNDAADVKFDREHRPERPIPSGQVTVKAAWGVGVGMLLAGAFLAFAKGLAHPVFIAGLLICIVFYDLYHKPWAGSVYVMGACRTMLIWMAGSARLMDLAATETGSLICPGFHLGLDALKYLPRLVVIYGVAIGVYTVALSMAARSGGKSTVRFLLWMPLVTLLTRNPADMAKIQAGPVALIVVLAAFGLLLTVAQARLRVGKVDAAVGLLLAGFVIADALAICTTAPVLALVFVAASPVLRYWQRWIAAT
ncbi:MAG: UbiA family prenyltransferase [Prosthecobacter sp.]